MTAYDVPVTRLAPADVAVRDPDQTEPSGQAGVPEIVRQRLRSLSLGPDGWSWVVAGVVTLVAAIVRLVDLGHPGRIIFDETYYAPNAYALLQYGVEWQVQEGGANPVNGAPLLGDGPAYVVHPPLGKWMIALGEWAFGYQPYGWRIAAALAGTASVLMITRIGRRMFGSTTLGAAAGLLVALDGMHLVLSRTALLDIFLMFFLVAAFGTLLLDRDDRRARWLAAVAEGRPHPPSGWRHLPWWRVATAALLGAALAVKWSAAAFIPVFLVLAVVWDVGARRSAGVDRPWLATLRQEWHGWLTAAVVLPAVYLASWTGWFVSDEGYLRHRLANLGQSEPPVLGALLNLFHYHRQALEFHIPLDSDHPYASSWWQWLLLARPVAFHWSGEGACGAERCASAVLLLGTPLLWWSFLPALALALWLGIARRDWRVPPILLGAAAGIVPWAIIGRVSFYFYALPAQPFLVLAVVYVLGALIAWGRTRRGRPTLLGVDWHIAAVLLAGGYVLLVALNFAYFYPIYTGQLLPYEAWQARMWLSSWV